MIAFATVENPNAAAKYYLLLDDGTKLYTEETNDILDPDQGYPKDGRRVFVSYNTIEPESANKIKLKNMAYATIGGISENYDIGRNDRHQLLMLYIGGGDYLNALVAHYLTSASNSKHEVALIMKDSEEEGTVYFDLIYSNKGNSGYDYAISPICFDLSSLKEIYADSVKIVINTYEESTTSKSYSTVYKWQ
jgi:uncharacterized protein (UPF0333 family)